MTKQNKAFTLVELIVVITILAILATLGFISLTWYSQESRDAKRVADLATIHKGLQLYQTRESTLPNPWEKTITVWSGSTQLFTQWYVTKDVLNLISVSESVDPIGSGPYLYSVNASKTKFQLVAFLEKDPLSENKKIISNILADYSNRFTYSMWHKVWFILDPDSLTPIQEQVEEYLDLRNDTNNYKVVFSNSQSEVLSWDDLYSEIITQTNNNWKEKVVPKYNITFDKNGWTSWTDSLQLETNTAFPNIEIPAKDKCWFQGYFSEVNGQWTQYYDELWNSTAVFEWESDIILYAYYDCSTCALPLQISKTTFGWWWPDADIQQAIRALPAGTKICMKSSDNQWNGFAIEFVRNSRNTWGADRAESPWKVINLETWEVAHTYNCNYKYCFRQIYGTSPWSHNNTYAGFLFWIGSSVIRHPGCGKGPVFSETWVPSYAWACHQDVDFHW